MDDFDQHLLAQLLAKVGDHLAFEGRHVTVLVVGGAALSLRGWVSRTTHDVDVLAIETQGKLHPPPLPEALVIAARRVARDHGLAPDWLNAVIGAQWTSGLPPTVGEGLIRLDFGGLRVALAPNASELAEARAWVLQQDVALEFPRLVEEVCDHVRRRD